MLIRVFFPPGPLWFHFFTSSCQVILGSKVALPFDLHYAYRFIPTTQRSEVVLFLKYGSASAEKGSSFPFFTTIVCSCTSLRSNPCMSIDLDNFCPRCRLSLWKVANAIPNDFCSLGWSWKRLSFPLDFVKAPSELATRDVAQIAILWIWTTCLLVVDHKGQLVPGLDKNYIWRISSRLFGVQYIIR